MELFQLKQKWASDAGLSLAPPCSSFIPCRSRTSSSNSKENSPGCSSGVDDSDSCDRLNKRMKRDGDEEARRVFNVELHDSAGPLPCGWEQCLDLQSGEMYYYNAGLGFKTKQDPRKGVEEAGASEWRPRASNMSVLRTWNSYAEQLKRMEAARAEAEKLASRRRVVKGRVDKGEEYGSDGMDLSLKLSISRQGMKQREL